MTFESIIGQDRAIRLITRMLGSDRLPHALLFTGIDGVGRQTTAKALAMAVNCLKGAGTSACTVCQSCKKLLSGNHPDVLILKPAGAFIKIDQVRSLRRDLRFAPLEKGRRFIIINDAQTMNTEAANAILKILEEPPNNTHIILTATQTTDLLPTVVSRCCQIAFAPIPVEKIAERLVAEQGLDCDVATALAILAKGSLGRALSADSERWAVWRRRLLEQLSSFPTRSIHPLFAFAEALARDKNRLEDGLDTIVVWFRDVLMYKLYPEKILNRDFMTDIERASKRTPVNALFKKITTVCATRRAIQRNVNPRLALEVMMLRLYSNNQ